MARPAVSLCVVAMDEEEHIGACLRSADFVEEAVVVDSHSSDRTREIAASLGARVIERDWSGYVEQKNFCIDQASHEWILYLDADERLSPRARDAILEALERPDLPDGFELNRLNRYLGRWVRKGGWYPDRKLRLFRKGRGRFGGMNPHDRLRVDGRVERIDADILHEPYGSLGEHVRTIDRYAEVSARARHDRGRVPRVGDLTIRPAARFVRMYLLQRGFLEGVVGFVMAVTGAFYVFLTYAKLLVLHRSSGDADEL